VAEEVEVEITVVVVGLVVLENHLEQLLVLIVLVH
jgi:hypothetical protein